jgi:SAM-dependent methyltransferase
MMMIGINDDSLASIEFHLNWEKNDVHHTDAVYAQRVNFWRDQFPAALRRKLMGSAAGDTLSQSFQAGELVALPDERQRHMVPHGCVEGPRADGSPLTPRYGRFYPRGILRGVPGVFRGNIDPFRCTDMDDAGIRADFNHPLAGLDLRLDAHVLDVREKFEEHGGTTNDWVEQALTGPGMQSRYNGSATRFFDGPAFARDDASDDGRFYGQPRLVQHIDDRAIATISSLYGRLIPPGSRVLDLMSSWTSHLPDDLETASVTGLGMNAAELAANNRLRAHDVHDLNRAPRLPYPDASFDAVICTVSVEYLTRPFAVFADVARVLAPGGVFVVTFSDRWFPPKVVRIWKELHPFERMGMVLELFRQTEHFQSLATFSSQGWPRPANDKYADRMLFSDPVFGVWGYRRSLV